LRKSSVLLTTSSLALAALALSMPVAVAAQDAAAAENDDNVIFVTSRKRDENLIEVPLAVTVATAEQLQRDQIANINDLQRIAPALEISQTAGGESNGGARLRGLGTGVFNASVSSSVALVIDQVTVGNLSFPLLFDMAQIEVLRGPQGTLFGQGASAGVLNVATRAPALGEASANASLDFADKGTGGSEVGELIANAGLSVPLTSNMALRIATQYRRETGLQRSVTTGEDNVIADFGIRGRVLWEPLDTLSVMLNAEYGQQDTDGQTFFAIAIAPNSTAGFVPPGPPPRPAPVPIGAASTAAFLNPAGCAMPEINARAEFYCENGQSDLGLRMFTASGVIDLELGENLSLTSVTAVRDRKFLQFSRDFSRLTTGASARQERTQEDGNSFSQELRLNYAGDTIDLVGGFFYTEYSYLNSPIGEPPFAYGSAVLGQRVGFSVCPYTGVGFCPVAPAFTQENTKNDTTALFVDATVALSDQLELFGGLRYDDYSNTTTVQRLAATIGAPATFETEDSNLSGRIGLSYMPTNDLNLFASYSRGYKPPAVGTDPSGALFQLEPEKANAFELGVKVGVGGMQLTANVFHTELLNLQSQTSVFVGTALISRPLNISQVNSKGFELNAFGELFDGLNVNAGYQFNDISYPTGYLGDDGGNLGGTQFLNAPKHKFTLSGDYAVPVSEGVELFVNANVVWKSDVLLAARSDPRYRYPSHEIINGGFGVRDADGGWTASLFVRNLTKEREPTAYLASTFFGAADGGLRAWPLAGVTARVVGVRLGVEF
jgi:outer membrane receptor protein involved in Fe transport